MLKVIVKQNKTILNAIDKRLFVISHKLFIIRLIIPRKQI